MITNDKFEALKYNLKQMESVVVAFSGGVDSTFLLKVAHDVLGDKVIAVTANSPIHSEKEISEAIEFTENHGINHHVFSSEELQIEGFADNPINRCYLCKNQLLKNIKQIAYEKNIKNILEGSNIDDMGDYRPGLQAVSEHHVLSPLKEAGLNKNEIRVLSKEMGLETWNKPSLACLASRIPYGQRITVEKLKMIDKAEQLLLKMGFHQVRVRHHEDIARVEIGEEDFPKFIDRGTRERISIEFKNIGFRYTALDLNGYRTGSMNEGIDGLLRV